MQINLTTKVIKCLVIFSIFHLGCRVKEGLGGEGRDLRCRAREWREREGQEGEEVEND